MAAQASSMSLGAYPGQGTFENFRSGLPTGATWSMPDGGRNKDGVFQENSLLKARYDEAMLMTGPPEKTEKDDPRGPVPREIDMLPTIWENRRLPKVQEILLMFRDVNLIRLLQRVAPIEIDFQGNPVKTMKQYMFHPGRPDEYTHTGVPRMVYHSFRQWDTAMSRRGEGLEMEAEFFGTREGSKIFQYSLERIQWDMMHSAGIDVINALIRTRPPPKDFYEAQRLPMPYDFLDRAVIPEIRDFGCLTKSKYGMMELVSDIKRIIRQAGGNAPEICILPEWFRDYVRTHTPSLTSFSERGERGPAAFDSNGVLSVMLGGLEVIESPVIFADDPMQKPEEPLEADRVIGSHWYNTGNHLNHLSWAGKEAAYAAARAFTIHDNDTDSWAQISLAQVAEALTTRVQTVGEANVDAKVKAKIAAFVGAVKDIEDAKNGDPKQALATLKNTVIIILRPFETWRMVNAIFCRGNGQSVKVSSGFADFRLGFDTARKKILGHYTVYLGAIVVAPQDVYVQYNVAASEYSGGGGSKPDEDLFFIITDQDDPVVKRCAKVLPINGGGFNAMVVSDKDKANQQYSFAEGWAKFYGFPTESGANMLDVGYDQQMYINTRTILATGYAPSVNSQGEIIHPRGYEYAGNNHWGPFVYPGVREDRLGRGAHGRVVEPAVHGA